MDGKPLKEIIAEGLSQQGWSVKKLAEATNVPERYLRLLLEGELRKLPPAPYVRGYLTKIAQALDLERDNLWLTYKDEIITTSSGQFDMLPINRFAIKSTKKKIIIAIVLVLLIAVYLGWNLNSLIGLPSLEINSPTAETVISNEQLFVIEGKTEPANKLTINGEQLYLDNNGFFKKELSLQDGLNTIEVKAKKFLGREVRLVKKIILQKAVIEAPLIPQPKSTEPTPTNLPEPRT